MFLLFKILPVIYKGEFGLDFLGGFGSSYSDVTNTLVKMSSPKYQLSKNILLVNCHTDSAIGGLGMIVVSNIFLHLT